MKKTLKNLVLRVTLAGVLSLLGCSDKKIASYTHNGIFNGFPVEIGLKDNQRYIRISESLGNRGYKPAYIIAKDIDPNRFGFEYEGIQSSNAYDLKIGDDLNKIDAFKKFTNPIELERIFAYVNADREESQKKR